MANFWATNFNSQPADSKVHVPVSLNRKTANDESSKIESEKGVTRAR